METFYLEPCNLLLNTEKTSHFQLVSLVVAFLDSYSSWWVPSQAIAFYVQKSEVILIRVIIQNHHPDLWLSSVLMDTNKNQHPPGHYREPSGLWYPIGTSELLKTFVTYTFADFEKNIRKVRRRVLSVRTLPFRDWFPVWFSFKLP